MKITEPQRTIKEVIFDNARYSHTFLGDNSDTTTGLLPSTLTEWSVTTTYNISDRVKISELGMEYVCLIDETIGVYPEGSSDWVAVTMNEFAYRDSAPSNQSFGAEGTDLVFYLNLAVRTDSLFIQNMSNIARVIVEGVQEDNTHIRYITTEDGESLTELLTHSCYNCCETVIEVSKNFTLDLKTCSDYRKIKVTLIVNELAIPAVGTIGTGTVYYLGCLSEYPDITLSTTAKFEITNMDLNLQSGHAYTQISVTSRLGKEEKAISKLLNKMIMRNIGELCFYDLDEFPEKDVTKILGFHKSASMKYSKGNSQSIGMSIYGIPSI